MWDPTKRAFKRAGREERDGRDEGEPPGGGYTLPEEATPGQDLVSRRLSRSCPAHGGRGEESFLSPE